MPVGDACGVAVPDGDAVGVPCGVAVADGDPVGVACGVGVGSACPHSKIPDKITAFPFLTSMVEPGMIFIFGSKKPLALPL